MTSVCCAGSFLPCTFHFPLSALYWHIFPIPPCTAPLPTNTHPHTSTPPRTNPTISNSHNPNLVSQSTPFYHIPLSYQGPLITTLSREGGLWAFIFGWLIWKWKWKWKRRCMRTRIANVRFNESHPGHHRFSPSLCSHLSFVIRALLVIRIHCRIDSGDLEVLVVAAVDFAAVLYDGYNLGRRRCWDVVGGERCLWCLILGVREGREGCRGSRCGRSWLCGLGVRESYAGCLRRSD